MLLHQSVKEIGYVFFQGDHIHEIYEAPYFEAYPIDGDTARFSNNEVDLMMETIERELNGVKGNR